MSKRACPTCGKNYSVRRDGRLRMHKCTSTQQSKVSAWVPDAVWPHVVLRIPSNWIHAQMEERTELRITKDECQELITSLLATEEKRAVG